MKLNRLNDLYKNANFSELELECKKLIKRGKATADTMNLLALSYKNLGQIDLAISTFKKGIFRYPLHGLLLSNLANIYMANGALLEATEFLNKAVKLTPNHPDVHSTLGFVLMQREELEMASRSFKKALEIEPSNPKYRYNVANIYRKMNKLKNAAIHFEGLNIGLSQSHLAECLYLDGQYDKLKSKLNELNERDVTDPLISAITEHTRITLNLENPNAFCSRPLSHIYTANIDLTGPTGKALKKIKEFAYSREPDYKIQAQQALLNNGVQSPGNLLDLNQPFVKSLRRILELSVNAYRAKFSNSEEPFLKYWPKDCQLYAWLVIMKSQGFLQPHIHKEGWLSGSLYLDVPKTKVQNEGAISFGLHGAGYPDMGRTFEDHPVQVKEGLICMFPSSLFHKTIPFRSSQSRISLAFDVIPAR